MVIATRPSARTTWRLVATEHRHPQLGYNGHTKIQGARAREVLSTLRPAASIAGGTEKAVGDAIEMSLHEADERCALEGALHELEARGREAEEIANTEDKLLSPHHIEDSEEQFREG